MNALIHSVPLPEGVEEYRGMISSWGLYGAPLSGLWWADWMVAAKGRQVVLRYWPAQGVGNVFALGPDGEPGELMGSVEQGVLHCLRGHDQIQEFGQMDGPAVTA